MINSQQDMSAKTDAKESQVGHEVGKLISAANLIGSTIADLEERLANVLTIPENPPDAKVKEEESLVHLAHTIREERIRISNHNNVLENLIARLQN